MTHSSNLEDAAELAHRNYVGTLVDATRLQPAGEIVRSDGIVLVASESFASPFNFAFVEKSDRDPMAMGQEIDAFFAQRQLAFTVRVRDDTGVDMTEAAEKYGWSPCVNPMPAMNAPCDDVNPPLLPDGVTIARVTSDDDVERFSRLLARCFGTDTLVLHSTPALFAGDRVVGWMAIVDDEIAGTVDISRSADFVGIYDVCTAPKRRHRGIATALVGHAMHHARTLGCQVVTLQASVQGRPVYEKLGFTTVLSYNMWEKKQP